MLLAYDRVVVLFNELMGCCAVAVDAWMACVACCRAVGGSSLLLLWSLVGPCEGLLCACDGWKAVDAVGGSLLLSWWETRCSCCGAFDSVDTRIDGVLQSMQRWAFKNDGELEDRQGHQLTGNGSNNQPSWDGSFKPTLLKDEMTHWGLNQKKGARHCLDVSKVCKH
jgi:hypothetical protein